MSIGSIRRTLRSVNKGRPTSGTLQTGHLIGEDFVLKTKDSAYPVGTVRVSNGRDSFALSKAIAGTNIALLCWRESASAQVNWQSANEVRPGGNLVVRNYGALAPP